MVIAIIGILAALLYGPMPRTMRAEYPSAIYHVMSFRNIALVSIPVVVLILNMASYFFADNLTEDREGNQELWGLCGLLRVNRWQSQPSPGQAISIVFGSGQHFSGLPWSAKVVGPLHNPSACRPVSGHRVNQLSWLGVSNGILSCPVACPWSSFGWYLSAPEHRPGWRRVDRLLGEHGIEQDSAAGRGFP